MSLSKTITKNATWQFASHILANVCGFILIVLLARFLGDEKLGLYSFAFAFTSLFYVIFDLGITQWLIKVVARNPRQISRYYANATAIKFISGIIGLVLPVLVLFFWGANSLTLTVVAIASVAMFFNYFSFIFRSLFTGTQLMEYDAITSITERILAVLLGGIVIYLGYGIVAFVTVFLISYGIAFLLYIIFTRQKISRLRLQDIKFKYWATIIKESAPFWFSAVFLKIYFQIDIVMLSVMSTYAATGIYNAAYSLVNGLSFIAFVTVLVTFPVMSGLHQRNTKALQSVYEKSFQYLAMIGLPIAIGTMLLAPRIIVLVYKEAFINSALPLQILVWAEIFLFFNYLMGYLLNSIDLQKKFTYSTGLCAIGNILLNFLLIPQFTYTGAAIATLVTELINFSILMYFTVQAGYHLQQYMIFGKIVLAGCIMAAFLYFMHSLAIFPLIIGSAVIYLLTLILVRAIGIKEFQLLSYFVGKK